MCLDIWVLSQLVMSILDQTAKVTLPLVEGAGEPTDGTCVRVEQDAGVCHQDDGAHLGNKEDGKCC